MIVALADVKTYLNIPSNDTTENDFITGLINKVQSEIETYCNQPIIHSNITEVYDKNSFNIARNAIVLSYFPINSISLLRYKETPTSEWIEISNTEYLIYKIGYIYHIALKSNLNINYLYEATFNVGYTNIPNDIEQVAIEMTVMKFKDSGRSEGNLDKLDTNRNIGGNTVNEKSSKQYLDYKHKVILQQYRMALI